MVLIVFFEVQIAHKFEKISVFFTDDRLLAILKETATAPWRRLNGGKRELRSGQAFLFQRVDLGSPQVIHSTSLNEKEI